MVRKRKLKEKEKTQGLKGLRKLFNPIIQTKPKPKKISREELLAITRIRQLKKLEGMSNLNYRDVVRNFKLKKDIENIRMQYKQTRLSPHTELMLENLAKIQNKSKEDDQRHQRVIRERRAMGNAMNLMKAHENLNKVRLDFSGVSEDNILKAENTFKENPENNILRTRGRTILDTGEDNTLKF